MCQFKLRRLSAVARFRPDLGSAGAIWSAGRRYFSLAADPDIAPSDRVIFEGHGRHGELLEPITPDDVRWIGDLLAALTNQVMD